MEQFRSWKYILPRGGLCYRVTGDTDAFLPSKVIGGYSRPYGGPNLWSSEDLAWDPTPTLTVTWPEPVEVSEVVVILDDDVEEDLINLHHHRTPYEVLPTLLNSYTLEAHTPDGAWHPVATVDHNHHRRQSHRLPHPTTVTALRLTATTTNGSPRAHIISIRAY